VDHDERASHLLFCLNVLEEEMQVEMPVLKPSKVRARSKASHGSATRFTLSMTLMLIFCASSALAQKDAASKPSSSEKSATTSPAVVQTRSRRAEADASNAPGNEQNEQASEKSVAADAPAAEEQGVERLTSLRNQIEAAKSDAERARLQRTLIDYLVALDKKHEAIAELRVMSREERIDPIGFYNIGNALARLGDTDTAIDAYRKAIKQRHGNYARAFNNLGVMLLRQGRWDEAQEALLSALRLENFRYSEASYNLGRVYSERGEADLAIREWSRALNVEPDHADAAVALARAYAEDGSPERGLAILDAFITRRGPSVEITDARREIIFGSRPGELSKTTVDSNSMAARPASAANTNSPAARNSSAPVVASRDNDRPMLETVSKADAVRKASNSKSGNKNAAERLRPLTIDRETYALLQRARAAREKGRNEEAAKLYRNVLSRSNDFFPPANLELGFVLGSLHRYSEAAATLAAVANREGARYPIAYYHLGRQYELLGQFNLAAEAYEKAATAYGDTNPQFLLDLSRVREKEGNAQAALAAMESYVRISKSIGRAPDWSDERLAELRRKAEQK
jgi:tetratricopeptide (TPR) repeat protein